MGQSSPPSIEMSLKKELDIKSILSRAKGQSADPLLVSQDSVQEGERAQTASAIMSRLQEIKNRLKKTTEASDQPNPEETAVNKFMEETKFPKMVADFMEDMKRRRREINESRDFFCKTDFEDETAEQSQDPEEMGGDLYETYKSRTMPASELLEVKRGVARVGDIPAIASAGDDGIYVGRAGNRGRLVRRLFRDGETQGPAWIDGGGRLIQMPDPVRERAFQSPPEQMRREMAATLRSHNAREPASPARTEHYSLNIDCNALQFGHHDLFSGEHVLFRQLCDLYAAYVCYSQKGNVEFCLRRVAALKRIIGTSRGLVGEAGAQAGLESAILEYYEEIRGLRAAVNEESLYGRELSRRIIRVWKEIKQRRISQGFTATPAKLRIKKKCVDPCEDEKQWNAEIAEEVDELREYHSLRYERETREFRYLMEVWKDQKESRVKLRDRIADNKKILSTLANVLPSVRHNIQEEILRDKAALARLKKPSPPAEFDAKWATDSVEEGARKSRRLPGEEMYSLELSYNEPVSLPGVVSAGERARRAELGKQMIHLRLLVDGVFVCKTAPRPISETFEVAVGSILTVCLTSVPAEVVVEVVQSHGLLSSRSLSRIPLPLPESTVTQSSAQLRSYNFSSLLSTSHTHAGVGSNVDGQPLINGNFLCSVFWTRNENGDILAPSNIEKRVFEKGHCHREPEISKLMEWAKKAKLDPNDVENAEILRLIEAKSRKSTAPACFRLSADQSGGFDGPKEEKRFKLLFMRAQDVGQFSGLIPAFDSEIQEGLPIAKDTKVEKADLNQFEKKQRVIRAYLRLVYENILRNIRKGHKQRTFNQIVREIEITPTDWSGIAELFKARRPLRPKRVVRTKGLAESVEKFTIFVHVRQAHDLPVRTIGSKRDTVTPEKTTVLAEVRFLDKVRRTRGCVGENPNWNEKVEISFEKAQINLGDQNSLPANPLLFINVYDKIEIVPESESSKEKRFNKILLGGLGIPFSSLYTNSRIEGKFNIEKPRLQSGYSNEGHSLLDVFVTIDPILEKGSSQPTRFESDELPDLLLRADHWIASFRQRFPNRHAVALVLDMNAKLVFAPRFLHSIPPPQSLLATSGSFSQEQKIAKFVSLFPNISDDFLYSGVDDLWSTCDQFISVRLGDEEEHAILLYNFFRAMGKKVFLVAGTAIPDGKTFYVLSDEGNSEFVIWNSVTGRCWPAEDSTGALKSIGCLMTSNNIFLNIQDGSAPWEITFQTSVSKAWLPLFGSDFPQKNLATVQPSFLNYSEPDESFAYELSQEITQMIREKITMWRSKYITRWNRTCCRAFLNIIKKLEFNKEIEDSLELKNLHRSFIVSGYPFNLTFTTIAAVVEATFATGMHDITGNDVEFALAVHVQAYPCDVYSVWLYFGNLIRIYD